MIWRILKSPFVTGPLFALLMAVVSLTYLTPDHQFFVAVGGGVLFFLVRRHDERWSRCFLMVLSIVVSGRYLVWRFTSTLDLDGVLQGSLVLALAVGEIYTTIRVGFTYFQLAWPLRRQIHPLPEDEGTWPVIDVYVPTYNEDISIVRTTVLGCLSMDWPADRLNVYILDDGRRRAFRDFAGQVGAGYINRAENVHAKAGNLNHAIGVTSGDIIAIFDCDHVPVRGFLKKTVGWMLADPNLALLQTPHHFYSPDPFRRNMSRGMQVPPESNLFYGLLQDGNDFWNATFFCGSCALLRRRAIVSINGFATETVTEDAHTALRMQRKGWGTGYLREPLAAGLETETLLLQIGQRVRWARGMFQMLRIDNPMLGRGLRLTQRICYMAAATNYFFAIPRMMFLLAPLAYLFLGVTMIAASPYELAVYALPHLFHTTMTMSRLQGRWRYSFWSEIYESMLAPFLVRMTFVTMIAPHKGSFNVTDKGGLLDRERFDWRASYPGVIVAVVLAVGLVSGIWAAIVHYHETLVFRAMAVNSIWVLFSLIIVLGGVAAARETRQRRHSHRVAASLPFELVDAQGQVHACRSVDVSMGGCQLDAATVPGAAGGRVMLRWSLPSGPATMGATIIARCGGRLHLQWVIAGLASERQVVALVFGRDDAWARWSDFPPDRPLRSLYLLVASICALFRPPPRVRDETPHAVARKTAAQDETLPRQQLVIPPDRTVVLRDIGTALVLAAMLLLPAMDARAQAAPAMADAGPAVVADGSVDAIDNAHMTSADVDEVSHQPVTRTRTLADMGRTEDMVLRANAPLHGLSAGVGRDIIITAARLGISGTARGAAGRVAVAVSINNQDAGVICPTADGAFGPVDLPLSPMFLDTRNRINFRLFLRAPQPADPSAPACGPDARGRDGSAAQVSDPGVQVVISPRSTLTLTTVGLVPHRLLSALPYPVLDPDAARTAAVTFVLPGGRDPAQLEAAGMVASWLGLQSRESGIHFNVAAIPPDQGSAVAIAPGQPGPWGRAPAGPALAVMPNPHDRFGTVLVVTGRTPAEVRTAAQALVLGAEHDAPGAFAAAPVVHPPARQPYDAPGVVRTDRPVTLRELVSTAALRTRGLTSGTLDIALSLPPDLRSWRSRPFMARLQISAPEGGVLDRAKSRVSITLNGTYLHSYPLVPLSLNPFRTPGAPVEHDLELPVWKMARHNELRLYFDVHPRHMTDAAAAASDAVVELDPSSTIDFSKSRHFAVLPDVALFAASAFPFSRMADLSETTVLLPPHPADGTVGAFVDMMGFAGAISRYPATGVTVRATDMPVDASVTGDILLLSTLDGLGNGRAALARAGCVRAPSLLARLRARVTQGRDVPACDFTQGALVAAQSPFAAQRSVVAVLGGTPDALSAMVRDLRDPADTPRFQGDMVIRHGARLDSYRTGGLYTVGNMPAWMLPDWYLGGHPLLLCGLGGLAALCGTSCAMRVLGARSRRRILNDDLTGDL
ncbi:UDP-forming cellulose synthase catalytic subunit [Komagataeibacter rhaeticus]|uniref:Cellulose synthase catalytic subunit [UDP-forming] n=1 Tax=Komagataeibacter rhaeticus TaxID=215221 RepID=A0A181CBL0_9PROT|nr:UDP-forming cellulose synthase catalytic subunit [Komagataeibacter rhaeticus]ATU72397.1 cellulose synthase catalytic subunit (UDP-forming) [Komagataeibacter xylinus]QIP35696.1 UDP-forming cellulose synthase catalytic subunit [Komagataeibacter rhaeticus]QOC45453.1 UDP-forming cellulose synthase catalytic subunit [Komagataeibacter rhaeticus]WPP22135.1 UDP-forming cellulose synthase catalytic subunit [Komagataeibacter rhaeticus]SAY48957.1 Cellulose synthase 1 [Komagataeibacter rhaeticus]